MAPKRHPFSLLFKDFKLLFFIWCLWCSGSTRVCGALGTGSNPVRHPAILASKDCLFGNFLLVLKYMGFESPKFETQPVQPKHEEESRVEQVQESTPEINETMEKASKTLSRDDFLYFEKTLKERGEPFNPEGMAMHTTNDYNFEKILSTGNIRTDEKQEGIYGTKGASFTDGNFEMALTFQTVFDDQNTRSLDKKFNSERYSDKAREFVGHFWDKKQEETKQYLGKIGGGKNISTIEDALKIAESFKFKAKPKEIADDLERLSRLFGVTIVYDKDKLPDLTTEGTEGLQKDFELRSYKEGGVPIKDASIVFVPEARMDEISSLLKENGLEHIEIRPSEELEIARMAKLLERK